MLVSFDSDGFESSLEERSVYFLLGIEITGIAVAKIAHEAGNTVVFILFKEEMEVVGHEREGDDGNNEFFLGI